MGKLFKGLLKKKANEKVKSEKVKENNRKNNVKLKSATTQEKKVEVKDERELVKKGYARKGDLIATVIPAKLGKEGKNIFGESIPAPEVYQPKLVPGRNVKVEQGNRYIMDVDGIVEVLKDSKGVYYIRGKLYRHGKYKIVISDDEMKAYLSVTPPIGGGRPLNPDEIIEACKQKGITFGLKEDVIRETVKKSQEEVTAINDVLIAEGEEPIDGEDGKVEFKVRLASGNKFKVLENGRVDYKEQDLITVVEEGDLIATVVKPKPGQRDGHTVLGEVIEAKPGHDVNLEIGNNIRVEDKGDEIYYYAAISGQLVNNKNTISVEPIYVVEGDVGPKTGNIKFKGAVLVKGSVNDGFSVLATGDITIQGNVGSSVIKSNGKVIVQNGFVGKGKGMIYADGDVEIKFAENAIVKSGANINIVRAALNCKLTAGEKIISVKEKGQIIGGIIKAKMGVEVKSLGNELEHKMDVFVGMDFITEDKVIEIRNKLNKYAKNLQRINLVIEKIKKVSEDINELPQNLQNVYNDARKKKTLVLVAIDNLKKKEMEYTQKISQPEDAEIIVHETIYPGVKIFFGDKLYEIDSKKSHVKIVYDKDMQKVRVLPLS